MSYILERLVRDLKWKNYRNYIHLLYQLKTWYYHTKIGMSELLWKFV